MHFRLEDYRPHCPGTTITRDTRIHALAESRSSSNLSVSACPHPFKPDRVDFTVPVGLTIAEIVEVIQVDPLLRDHGVVFLDDQMVERRYWRAVRPKPGVIISIRILPASGGGLRIAALVAVSALAIVATVATGGLLAPVIGATGAGLVGGLLGAGITIGGGLLVNMLIPPPKPKISQSYGAESVTYAITGQRNQARPWEKVPFLCGRFKMTPPYAALPYREVVGSDIYWRSLFVIGHGPIHIEEMRIGETNINDYQGVEIESRRGYWSLTDKGSWTPAGQYPSSSPTFGDTWSVAATGSAGGITYYAGQQVTFNGMDLPTSHWAWDVNQAYPFGLFPSDVYEDTQSVDVIYGQPPTRTSQLSADEIGVELIFPRGIVHLQNSPPGKKSDRQIVVSVQQAPVGTGNWTTVTQQTVTGRQTTPLYWGWRWRTTDYGAQDANRQYDVRVHNLTGQQDEERNFGNFSWYAIRTFTMQNPVPISGIAMIALRIKGSGQLSGALEEFNVTAWSMCRDWHVLYGQWLWRPTSSPAAIFRHMLQHPTRQMPATDAQLDLEKLQYWDGLTRPNNRTFNGVFDSKGSLYEALTEVCRVGRAVPTLRGMRYSVIIDEPKTVPVRMFTPSNSWDYQGEMSHQEVPNAYRIGYVNAEKSYSPQEVVVYDDGYNGSNATRTELVQWVGIDNQNQAWREGRFHLAQQRLRRETHKIKVDFEHLCCERGDLVALQYDTIAVGLGSARVAAVTETGALVTAVRLTSAMTMAAGKSYAMMARRIVNNVQRTDSYAVQTVAGEQYTLNLAAPPFIVDAPDVGDLIAFGETGRETLRVIVRDIEPANDLTATLTLISEGAGVHQAEFGPIPPWDPVVTLPVQLPAPQVLAISSDARVMMVTASRALIDRVVFALVPISIDGAYLRIIYRLMGTESAWLTANITEQSTGSIAIIGPESGESYDFRLQYLHPSLLASPVAQVNSYYVIGRTAAPEDLQSLSLGIISGQALLRWDLPPDLDVQYGGWVMFRHSPLLENANWPDSTTIAQAVSGDQTHCFMPLKPGTYFGRVYDADGRGSANPRGISTKQAALLAFSPIGSVQEDPTFVGSKQNCAVVSDGLSLTSGNFDDVVDVDLLATWDVTGGIADAGLYLFSAGIDLGEVKRARFTSKLQIAAINELSYWDSRTGNIDEWDDVDNTIGANVDAMIYGKFTDDDPANPESAWTDFVRVDSLDMESRALGRLEARLYSTDETFNLWVTQLRVSADVVTISPDTIETLIDGGGPSA